MNQKIEELLNFEITLCEQNIGREEERIKELKKLLENIDKTYKLRVKKYYTKDGKIVNKEEFIK